MTRMIFVNLPVADLDAAKAFYARLGFVNEPKFTDETAAAMQWSDAIAVMLLTRAKWQTFTTRPIPDKSSSEVMLAISLDSKAEVDRITDLAGAEGEFAIRRAGDWYAADIESRPEPAIDLHFTDTCGMALSKRGEIHVGKPHRALDLPRLGTRQEH